MWLVSIPFDQALVVELADMPDSSPGAGRREGSNPSGGTAGVRWNPYPLAGEANVGEHAAWWKVADARSPES